RAWRARRTTVASRARAATPTRVRRTSIATPVAFGARVRTTPYATACASPAAAFRRSDSARPRRRERRLPREGDLTTARDADDRVDRVDGARGRLVELRGARGVINRGPVDVVDRAAPRLHTRSRHRDLHPGRPIERGLDPIDVCESEAAALD